jgi:hypothetical protein
MAISILLAAILLSLPRYIAYISRTWAYWTKTVSQPQSSNGAAFSQNLNI